MPNNKHQTAGPQSLQQSIVAQLRCDRIRCRVLRDSNMCNRNKDNDGECLIHQVQSLTTGIGRNRCELCDIRFAWAVIDRDQDARQLA